LKEHFGFFKASEGLEKQGHAMACLKQTIANINPSQIWLKTFQRSRIRLGFQGSIDPILVEMVFVIIT